MIEWFETLDHAAFLWLNGCHHPALDVVMKFISGKWTWIPLYVILAVMAQRKFGWKGFGLFLILAAITVTLTDQTSVKLFKNVFERYRPCHNHDISHLVHIVDGHCGGKYGFVSSHAANHFGIAVFIVSTMFTRFSIYWWGLLIWAAVVSYSRIYLGVHFPADIVAGAGVGSAIGFATAFVFARAHQSLVKT